MGMSTYVHPEKLPRAELGSKTDKLVLNFDNDAFIFLNDEQVRVLADLIETHLNKETVE